jgi:Tripartite tricarboxylate transporter family receptor
MKLLCRKFLHLAAGAAAVTAFVRIARAQTYPTRPITMIVPYSAGGPTDFSARIVGDHLSRTLGQQIIIENVVGAGGTTGTTRAMRANPDGYTIEMGQIGTRWRRRPGVGRVGAADRRSGDRCSPRPAQPQRNDIARVDGQALELTRDKCPWPSVAAIKGNRTRNRMASVAIRSPVCRHQSL